MGVAASAAPGVGSLTMTPGALQLQEAARRRRGAGGARDREAEGAIAELWAIMRTPGAGGHPWRRQLAGWTRLGVDALGYVP